MKQRIIGWTSTEELLNSVQLKMATRGLRCRQNRSRRASRAEPGNQQTEPGLQQNLQHRDGSGTHQTLPKMHRNIILPSSLARTEHQLVLTHLPGPAGRQTKERLFGSGPGVLVYPDHLASPTLTRDLWITAEGAR